MDLNFQTCLVYHGFGTKSPNPWNLIAVPKTLVDICFSPISFFLAFVSGDYFFSKSGWIWNLGPQSWMKIRFFAISCTFTIAKLQTFNYYSHSKKFVEKTFGSPYEAHFLDYVSYFISWDTLSQISISQKNKKVFHQFFSAELHHYLPDLKKVPLVRFELKTPGFQDQCSTTEL